jgi:dTDP-4-dehydrorhamnose reductase
VRVLITGAGGQLGQDLIQAFEDWDVVAADHAALDVGDRDAVLGAIGEIHPDAVVHGAAWTAVDACESDPDRAFRVNALGCRHVAEACRRTGAYLSAVSTDYVFDGRSQVPYTEWDPTNPMSVYGRSKLGGEREVLTGAPGASVVRTSWLCGAGGPNFVKTMLRLAAEGSGPLTVVADQHGCPTFTNDLAGAIRRLVASRLPGTFHVTNQGPTTWCGLARDVFRLAGADPERVVAISTAELHPPRPAPRPANSVLDNAALRLAGLPLLPDHREPLEQLLKGLVS